ncbi:MAG: glycosyltransferase family 39 protein [Pseudomonadota bacterium]|nr:glycosyltransferase family 39 protein [Pseudomonadota bacterium]
MSAAPSRAILLFVAATLAARLVAIFATGFCDDEAYVVAISRAPALSYFDHPPLHQWILWGWTSLFGEGRAARLPFFGFSLVTAFALFGLTRRLFSSAAAWWTLFVFSGAAYFLVYPDGYIMPDLPLLAFCALGVWAVAEILYGPPGRESALWLASGLALGLAGLSKYAAIFVPIGLAGFFLTSARGRRWLADPRPYLAAALGVVCLTPALVWNAQHGWVSLAFQSGRAARALSLNGRALGEIAESLGAQIASMTPWLLIPLLGGLARACRRGANSPERLLLWLAAPALVLFALMPLLGQRPISHWFNSGWLFAFPLAGAWLAERTPLFLGRFRRIASALAGIVFALYLSGVMLGPITLGGLRDPTRGMYDWPAAGLRAAYARSGAQFVLIENWRQGGRVGVALGPEVPICAMGSDPRGFAFACDAARRLGQSALIVRALDKGRAFDETPDFRAVEPDGELPIGRRGIVERRLTLEIGRELTRAPPLPYGP